ncbi:hypothetical protein [Methylobacterium sp. E-046]|uniref:hypothetical protein n=1 Tax=Methylobacterium sp. E-046 TaxID=2836576 RepID=UPI001FBAA1D0|nr:hypothetical protein [Methylobacterium sp. E-046]MCJ2099472.1 hypothetical protein [Methylobacterium sp. E-046]
MENVFTAVIASLTTVTALTAGVVWFGGKATEKLLDVAVSRIEHQHKLNESRFGIAIKSSLDFKSQQLNDFYWPIYIRLQKDNAIWNRILDKRSKDDKIKAIGREIEMNEVLPNHTEIVQIIQSKIHLSQASPELQAALMQYVRHVAVYKAMRAAGDDDRFPIALGEVWPDKLFGLIEANTKGLQKDFDRSLSETLNEGR